MTRIPPKLDRNIRDIHIIRAIRDFTTVHFFITSVTNGRMTRIPPKSGKNIRDIRIIREIRDNGLVAWQKVYGSKSCYKLGRTEPALALSHAHYTTRGQSWHIAGLGGWEQFQ